MTPDPTYLRPETPPSPVVLARALDLLGEPDAAPVLCGWWTRGEFGPDVKVDQAGATESLRRVLAGAPAEVLGDRAVLDVLALSIPEGATITETHTLDHRRPPWRWAPMLLTLGVVRAYPRRDPKRIGTPDDATARVVEWLTHGRCHERHPASQGRCRKRGSSHHPPTHEAALPGGRDGEMLCWDTPHIDGATIYFAKMRADLDEDAAVTVTRRPTGPAVD